MREINNNSTNLNNVNFQGMSKNAGTPEEMPVVDSADVTDLSKMPSEVIGRSQVSKSALEKDLEPLFSNPEVVQKSLEFFEACEAYGVPPTKAAALMGGFAKEFFL